MTAVGDLVSGLDAELVRRSYKPSTMVWYRGCWRRLERWCVFRGVEELSLDVAMAWRLSSLGYAQRSVCQPNPTRACERTLRITRRCSYGSLSPL